MDGKEGSHQGAGPKAAGHLPQQQEQQRRGDRVQDDVHQVVPARVQPEQLAIQHVRIGRQRMVGIRMPVAGIIDQALPGEAPIDCSFS